MQFVALVCQDRKTMPLQDAIEKAVKECMAQAGITEAAFQQKMTGE